MKSRQLGMPMNEVLAKDLVGRNGRSISRGFYAARVKEFSRLAKDNVHLSVYEELIESPESEFRKMFDFLEVDNNFTPSSIRIQTKPGSLENRNWILYWFVKFFSSRSNAIGRLYSRVRKEGDDKTKAMEQRIRELGLYSEEIDEMERLLGRELRSWRTL